MIHRHLDYDESVPLDERGAAALDDLLDRGDLDDWAPLAAAVAADPYGAVAEAVDRICHAHPMYGTAPLWRAYLERCRIRIGASGPGGDERWTLARLRRSCGLTQVRLAGRLGMAQSDLSKLERRPDLRLSTLREYVSALGGRLDLVVHGPGRPPVRLRLPDRSEPKGTRLSGRRAGGGGDARAGASR